jgi:DNA-binding TFAR19-related protein (PDSD5 family)
MNGIPGLGGSGDDLEEMSSQIQMKQEQETQREELLRRLCKPEALERCKFCMFYPNRQTLS